MDSLSEIFEDKQLPILYSWNSSPPLVRSFFPHGDFGQLDPGDLYIAVGRQSGQMHYERLAERIKLSEVTLLHKEDVEGFRIEFIQSKVHG